MTGQVRVGIGGWNFAPWRGVFYPDKLPQAQELHYASRQVTSIEINSTFYRSQSPETFRKWREQTPDGFVFSVKAPRFATNRTVLAEAGESVQRFFASGVLELEDRLGPVLWQFAPTKRFDASDFSAFLSLLPRKLGGREIRHVVEVRHASFANEAFVDLLRSHTIPAVYTDHVSYPEFADLTGDFVYARLQRGDDELETAYPRKAIDQWSERSRVWSSGGRPKDLPCVGASTPARKPGRDVFMYFIHEGKVRAPAAAVALIEKLAKK